MRIAIDATPAAVQQAGVGRYSRELLRALLQLPGSDEYLLASAAPAGENARLLAALPPGHRRELVRLPLRERQMTIAWQRLRLPLPIERLIGSFDVFHGPDFVLPPSRLPRVVTLHDLSFVVTPELAEPALARYLQAAVPRSLAGAEAVITVSAAVAAEAASAWPWLRDRLVAIPNGVRHPERVERRTIDRPVVLSVGTIEPRKNHLSLLDAMRIVRQCAPDALLLIAGRIGWQSDEIVARIRQDEAHGHTRLIERPSDEQLDELYAGATLVAYPSLYEGFGLPVLEALARGVPVVTSDLPALRETGGDVATYVTPGDPKSIASGILRLLLDDEQHAAASTRGAAHASGFSWAETARRTQRVYARVARGAAR